MNVLQFASAVASTQHHVHPDLDK